MRQALLGMILVFGTQAASGAVLEPPGLLALGLSLSQDGRLLWAAPGAKAPVALVPEAERRVMRFLAGLPPRDPEPAMALALRSFLRPRLDPRDLEKNDFLREDETGRLVLTPLGKNALLDILMAQDGELLSAADNRRDSPFGAPLAGREEQPRLASLENRIKAAVREPEEAFDGFRHSLGDFDWSSFGGAVPEAGSLQAAGFPEALEGYAVDRERNTVRVLVAAERSARMDRLLAREADPDAVYEETGLDRSLFEYYGADLVRTVDNLVAVDVPLEAAAQLGGALAERGIRSRPARVFQAVAGALLGPAAGVLGMPLLPAPAGLAQTIASIVPQLADSHAELDVAGLWSGGMRGRGGLIGLIDSGMDLGHPDFRDAQGQSRVQAYRDFTGEGEADVIGHGTHVAGTAAGSGAASDGRYAGMAPEARFKMAKVFGKNGKADESVILAAMKWMAQGGPEEKADVVNMSLSGPGEPNEDLLGSMANRLTAKDHILVVAAAGNRGLAGRGTIRSPGSAGYVLTVSGVDKSGEFPSFPSQGPVSGSRGLLYSKPDVTAVAGGVDPGLARSGLSCIYSPGGVIAPRSSADSDRLCAVQGQPRYRYMSGTSMATPMVAGMAADVIAYLKEHGADYDPFLVRAVIMETARDLGREHEIQGSGLVQGGRLAEAVLERLRLALPIGNLAFALAMRLTTADRQALSSQSRYVATALGLLDTSSGHLVHTEKEMARALMEIRAVPAS